MSRFYGSIEGQAKTTATRRGSPASGLAAHARGWHLGAHVVMIAGDDDRDVVSVALTSGSAGDGPRVLVGNFSRADLDLFASDSESSLSTVVSTYIDALRARKAKADAKAAKAAR